MVAEWLWVVGNYVDYDDCLKLNKLWDFLLSVTSQTPMFNGDLPQILHFSLKYIWPFPTSTLYRSCSTIEAWLNG